MRRLERLRGFSVLFFLSLFALFALVPIVLVVFTSLKTSQELFRSVIAPPLVPRWENYGQVWIEGGFKRYFFNSVVITLPSVGITTIVATLAGYAFAKWRFPLRNELFFLILAGLMLPLPSIIIPLYRNLQTMGLINTRIGVTLVESGIAIPFGVFLMRTFIQGIPDELIEAMRIDGASEWQVIFRLVFPLSAPGMKSLALISFMWAWQSYLLPLVLITEDKVKPLTAALDMFIGRYSVSYGLIAAAAVIVFVPITLVFILTQKAFIQGITMGAIK